MYFSISKFIQYNHWSIPLCICVRLWEPVLELQSVYLSRLTFCTHSSSLGDAATFCIFVSRSGHSSHWSQDARVCDWESVCVSSRQWCFTQAAERSCGAFLVFSIPPWAFGPWLFCLLKSSVLCAAIGAVMFWAVDPELNKVWICFLETHSPENSQ